MERLKSLICAVLLSIIVQCRGDGETVLSTVLTPENNLLRQERSYYDRYGYGRPYDRFDDRPSRCGRCDDDDDDDDDYDRGRNRDDDRRSNKPTYGNRHDKNKYDDDDDRRYDNDRKTKNGTDDENDDKKHYDEKDSDRHHRRRYKNKHRNDDRDKYTLDYYDRFLRDPYRDRYYQDRYYNDPYLRPVYNRYPYPDRYDDYARYDGYYSAYRRPYYEDRYDSSAGYSDTYGGYGPGTGRGPHERPWDETYRGQAGWDAGGRGYYFASGRPDSTILDQREYSRPTSSGSGWQNVGYSTGNSGYSGYNNPGYRGSAYGGGYQDLSVGYGQSSGWRNVGERRPYRDQSGVAHLETKVTQEQNARYVQSRPSYSPNTFQPGTYTQSSTTAGTSYLFQRESDLVKEETTLPPS